MDVKLTATLTTDLNAVAARTTIGRADTESLRKTAPGRKKPNR